MSTGTGASSGASPTMTAVVPPGPNEVDPEAHRVGHADGDDRPVEALAGAAADEPGDLVLVAHVDACRWRRSGGSLEPVRRRVEGDDVVRRPEARAPWIGVHADPAGADHRAAAPGRHLDRLDAPRRRR